MTPRLPDPDACAWCEHPRRGHDDQWYLWASDRHTYQSPRDALRLGRMRARRAARLAAQQPPKPAMPEITLTITVEDRLTPAAQAVAESIDFLIWDREMRGSNS